MLRLLALGSYFYQSLVAILLILALSHLLEPASYIVHLLSLSNLISEVELCLRVRSRQAYPAQIL